MLEQLCDSFALLEEACKWRHDRPIPSVTLTFPAKADAEVFLMQLRHEVGQTFDLLAPLDLEASIFMVRGIELRLRWNQPKTEG